MVVDSGAYRRRAVAHYYPAATTGRTRATGHGSAAAAGRPVTRGGRNETERAPVSCGCLIWSWWWTGEIRTARTWLRPRQYLPSINTVRVYNNIDVPITITSFLGGLNIFFWLSRNFLSRSILLLPTSLLLLLVFFSYVFLGWPFPCMIIPGLVSLSTEKYNNKHKNGLGHRENGNFPDEAVTKNEFWADLLRLKMIAHSSVSQEIA